MARIIFRVLLQTCDNAQLSMIQHLDTRLPYNTAPWTGEGQHFGTRMYYFLTLQEDIIITFPDALRSSLRGGMGIFRLFNESHGCMEVLRRFCWPQKLSSTVHMLNVPGKLRASCSFHTQHQGRGGAVCCQRGLKALCLSLFLCCWLVVARESLLSCFAERCAAVTLLCLPPCACCPSSCSTSWDLFQFELICFLICMYILHFLKLRNTYYIIFKTVLCNCHRMYFYHYIQHSFISGRLYLKSS